MTTIYRVSYNKNHTRMTVVNFQTGTRYTASVDFGSHNQHTAALHYVLASEGITDYTFAHGGTDGTWHFYAVVTP